MAPRELTYLESLNLALFNKMKSDKKVVVIGEDILSPYGGAFKVTKGLSVDFPDRVISTPISEQAITGLSVGLALNGHKPVLEIMFGDFITLCVDQIINHAAKFSLLYSKDCFNFVLRTPMGGYRGYGPTHSQCLEKIFLGIPGVSVVVPSIFHDPGKLLIGCIDFNRGPVIFIENKLLYSATIISKLEGFSVTNCDSTSWPTVRIRPIFESEIDITIVTYGGISWFIEEVLLHLKENEISAEVYIFSNISDPQIEDLLDACRLSSRLLIVSEQSQGFGFAAEIIARIAEFGINNIKICRCEALSDIIPSSKKLEQESLPSVKKIIDTIIKMLQ
jgi:pyruvate/2-oxoglutarate/acetoin dehydrogenase E1 component